MSFDGLLVWCEPGPDSSRRRLPNRRECFTETIQVGNAVYDASVGFDAEGNPKEIFLSGGLAPPGSRPSAKTGSDMAAVLTDTGILVSFSLQSGIPAELLAPSMSRVPAGFDEEAVARASVLGVALDLVARYEAEEWR